MNKRNNSLMIAYLIFIVIAVVYKMICNHTQLTFDSWNNIIVATTISTYFFSIASIVKTTHDLASDGKKHLAELKEKVDLYYKSLLNEQFYNRESTTNICKFIEELDSAIKKEDEKIKKCEKSYYIIYILGFVSFFVFSLIVKNPISNSTQEHLVMLAFFAVLFSEFMYDTFKMKNDKTFKTFNKAFEAIVRVRDLLRDNYKRSSEEDNGQVENEN